ncbi:MAG: hypothetical protein GVY10_05525 [Verrucomicrobia bacterium]|nr:hypothetical protein [Verrucomicrobiota bacterium]
MGLLILFAAGPAWAAEPPFPGAVEGKGERLERVGTGTFKWMFFKVYDGAYYQDADRLEAGALDDVAKRLVLVYNRGITAGQFRKSGNEFVRRNVGERTYEELSERLARLNAAYEDVEKGDSYALTYAPGKGTTLALNGEDLVTIEGADFASAYFSIWLGDNPVKESFRQQLLSGTAS